MTETPYGASEEHPATMPEPEPEDQPEPDIATDDDGDQADVSGMGKDDNGED